MSSGCLLLCMLPTLYILKAVVSICVCLFSCRADLVRYYSSLSEVAEKCRQRAEWRIKRMNLKEQRLNLVSNDTEPVTTIRSPNNNEDLQDINSNLSNMNVLNKMDPEETGNNNVNTQNNTETMNTFITNYRMKISDVQSNTEASDREINVDVNSSFDVCLTQRHDNKTDTEMLPSCANIIEEVTDKESNKVEQSKGRDEQIIEVVSIVSLEMQLRFFSCGCVTVTSHTQGII